MRDTRQTITAYWASANARDWNAFADLVAEDVVYELPQTRERVRGRSAFVRFNAEYPGEWRVEVERLVADGQHAATWGRSLLNGGEETGLCFFDLDDEGRIARITDFWPTGYEPPAGREHLVERY
ncbi:MAG TPA: nuclear transport factor 2 family protein [Labilithrix sp.]|nr:nuclear transport factor 2 family protein [Labilithrix sp.]